MTEIPGRTNGCSMSKGVKPFVFMTMSEDETAKRLFGILKEARATGCTCDVLITIRDGVTRYEHESDCGIGGTDG